MKNLNTNNSYCYHFNYLLRIITLFSVIVFTFLLSSVRVSAMKPACYSYNYLYKSLPEKYQKSEFIYEANGVAKLAFGSYKKSGTDYRTSMKHSGDTLYYCVNYNNHFTDNKSYIVNNTMYSDELRARIGLAMHLGTTKWNTKANSGYTTGHFITDYFMTQMVIHGLIYKYGGKYSDQGVDFDSLTFKSGTGNLGTKTKNLFKACCNAKFKSKKGNFQNAIFSFEKPSSEYIYYDESQYAFVSEVLSCNIDADNGTVSSFLRESDLYNSAGKGVANNIIVNDDIIYNSPYYFKIPIEILHDLDPGMYTAVVSQTNNFNRAIANMWSCSDKNYSNNQEVMGISYADTQIDDKTSVKFFIGEAYIRKTDSLSGDIISDAEFQLYQFDNTSNEYKYYKDFTYDSKSQKYYSGKIFCNKNNPDFKFKVIEAKSGKNYINDWAGEEFKLSENVPVVEINVENKPILGGLHVHKDGDQVTFSKSESGGKFIKSDSKMGLPKVRFSLYAADNIYNKNVLKYKKDQKITDFVTDEKGDAYVNSLLPGKYYFTESETDKLYVLKNNRVDFEITYKNNQYGSFTYTLDNHLKKCSLEIYKYTSDLGTSSDDNAEAGDIKDKIPLSGCTFGLYAKDDIYNPLGKLIISKDTFIAEKVTDENGYLKFDDLIYSDYYIKELKVPDGIVLNNEIIEVNSDKLELKADTTDEYNVAFHIHNDKQEYKINLYKYGEQFIGVDKSEDSNGAYYKYKTEYSTLKDVKYSLYGSDGNLIDSKITDDNGMIVFQSLEYGNYTCIEDSAPGIYEVNSAPIDIDCTQLKDNNSDDKEGAIEVSKELYDKMCSCSLDIIKMGEKTIVKEKSLEYDLMPLSDVVFGIYQNFEYVFPNGEKLPANSCLGYLVTDENGKASYDGVLPEGMYYLKELKTLRGYDIDQNIHPFEISSNNNNKIIINLSNEPFINNLSKTSVKIIKTDVETGKKLKGVEFSLYNSDGEIIGAYTTNRKGEIIVDDLPYGNYYFIETKCKNGYYSSNNKYSFTLDSSEMRILQITNTPILKLGFEENYKINLIILFAIMSVVLVLTFSAKIGRKK